MLRVLKARMKPNGPPVGERVALRWSLQRFPSKACLLGLQALEEHFDLHAGVFLPPLTSNLVAMPIFISL